MGLLDESCKSDPFRSDRLGLRRCDLRRRQLEKNRIAHVREGRVTTWRVARWVVTAPLFAAVATNNSLNLKQQKQSQKLSLFVAHCFEEHRPAHQLVGSGFKQTQALLQLAIQRILNFALSVPPLGQGYGKRAVACGRCLEL